MAKYAVVDVEQREAELTEVADAIREHTGDSEKMTIPEMAQTLRKLPGPIVATAVGNPIALSDATDLKLRGLKLFGRTTQDGTPSPDNPVPLVSAGDGGGIGVAVAGKNLLNIDAALKTGVFEKNGDEYVLTKVDSNNRFSNWVDIFIPKGITYRGKINVLEYTGTTSENVGLIVRLRDGTDKTYPLSGFWTTETADVVRMRIYAQNSDTNGSYTRFRDAQIEIGSTATEYEPYKETQTAVFSTPNGLPGIPVTSGGNYTDETGQQWICDEVDFHRGVYVQRVGKVVFDGTEYWEGGTTANGKTRFYCNGEPLGVKRSAGNDGFFSHGVCGYTGSGTVESIVQIAGVSPHIFLLDYQTVDTFKAFLAEQYANGTPLTVAYILATPIETPLSAEELAAYAALHTNYPSTTILNDGGAGMEVSYVADTKNYIDNQVAAMAAAIVNA